MKKIILLIMVLFTAPAMGLVTIEVVDLGDGWAALDYTCTGANAVGFGLDVNVSAGVNIIDVNILHVGENDGNGVGFGIFPASFNRFIDPNDPNWGNPNYTPVAEAGDQGAAGGLPGPAITIELGALGIDAPNDGRLLELKVDGSCTMTVSNNSSRGGVVLKGGGDGGFAGASGAINLGPACWSCPTFCYADTNCDGTVNTTDFFTLKASWFKSDPDPLYNPCADFNKDGTVNTTDFFILKAAWFTSPPPDCP